MWVIIARYGIIIDQPEHAHLYNHLSNYTNHVYPEIHSPVPDFKVLFGINDNDFVKLLLLPWVLIMLRGYPGENHAKGATAYITDLAQTFYVGLTW